MRRLLLVLALVAPLALPAPGEAASTRGKVVRVVDGDSVRVKVGSRQRTVHLLGVRAARGRECFAAGARAALAKLLKRNARVRLVRDPGRRRGAALYVFKGRTLVNAGVLRAGAGRFSGPSRLRQAKALRRAEGQARKARRGIFGQCTDPSPPGGGNPGGVPGTGGGGSPGATQPAGPTPIQLADAVRNRLAGNQLVDFRSGGSSQTKNTTRFCAGGRGDRLEEFSSSDGSGFNTPLVGTWAILAAVQQPDGTVLAEVLFRHDDPSFDDRLIVVSLAADGTVRKPDASASELQPGGPCSTPQPTGGFENDTAAARDGAVQALTGQRLDETGASASTDFCAGARGVRRENGAVVIDGTWAVEYALADGTGRLAVLAVRNADGSVARRLLVVIPTGQAPQVRNLGTAEQGTRAATLSAAGC